MYILHMCWGISQQCDGDYCRDGEHVSLHLNNRIFRVPGNSLIKMEAGIRLKERVIKVALNVKELCDNTGPHSLNE